MTEAATTALDLSTVAKLKDAGHQVQYGWHKGRKDRWHVTLTVWHRNDAKRLDPRPISLNAWFHDADNAKAYAKLMRKRA